MLIREEILWGDFLGSEIWSSRFFLWVSNDDFHACINIIIK
jgi:hypothetical protein